MNAMEDLPTTAGPTVKRHRLSTRLWHWLNALLLYILFTSGLRLVREQKSTFSKLAPSPKPKESTKVVGSAIPPSKHT